MKFRKTAAYRCVHVVVVLLLTISVISLAMSVLVNDGSGQVHGQTIQRRAYSDSVPGNIRPILLDLETSSWNYIFRDLLPGGSSRPDNCTTGERTAIIIPCRDREKHLAILLANLIPFLRKQRVDFTFFVIDHQPPGPFNKGLLLNAGFLEASKMGNYSCFIFHDVDMLPLNDNNFYQCDADNPTHFVSGLDKWDYSLTNYGAFVLGGVISFTARQFLSINGASNLYFGWGGEDDDLTLRTQAKGMTPIRKRSPVGLYNMIKHGEDTSNPMNPHRWKMTKLAADRQDLEGLNTARYKVMAVDLLPLYTRVKVTVNVSDVISTAPREMATWLHQFTESYAAPRNFIYHFFRSSIFL